MNRQRKTPAGTGAGVGVKPGKLNSSEYSTEFPKKQSPSMSGITGLIDQAISSAERHEAAARFHLQQAAKHRAVKRELESTFIYRLNVNRELAL